MANNDAAGRANNDAASRAENRARRRAERRPDVVRQRRDTRKAQYEKERRNWMLVRIGGAVIVVLILAGIGWWGFRQWQGYQVSQDVTEYFTLDDYSIDHREGELLYEHIPPVGGPHNAQWQNCGFYDAPIYNWHAVHSMEHGAVWVTYDPEVVTGDDVEQLRELANQSYLLVSPYPGIPSPVVASVWGHQIQLDGVDDERLDTFIREYRLNPEYTPEPGAICAQRIDYTMEEGEEPQTEPAIISGSQEEVDAAEAEAAASPAATPGQ